MEEKYHMNFMRDNKYCFSRKRKFKRSVKNDDFDNLFFNLLNVLKHPKLDSFYNRKVEKELKLNICQELDNIKFSKKESLCEILSYHDDIDLPTFNMLCFYFKINVIYLCENVFFKMCYNENTNICYILNQKKELRCVKEDKIESLLESKYEIKNISKPINSMTYYKVNEMMKLYHDLGFKTNHDNMKKKQYYDDCKSYLHDVLQLK